MHIFVFLFWNYTFETQNMAQNASQSQSHANILTPCHANIMTPCHANILTPHHANIMTPCHANILTPHHANIMTPTMLTWPPAGVPLLC